MHSMSYSLAAGSDGVVKPTPQLKAVSMGVALAGKENKGLAQHVASLEPSTSLSDNDSYSHHRYSNQDELYCYDIECILHYHY